MSINELLEQALELKANERSKLIDELLKSLDKPDDEIDEIWEDESNKRLEAYKNGQIKAVSSDSVFQ